MGKMKARAENRCNSIDLSLNGIAPLSSPPIPKTLEQLHYEDPRAETDISRSTPVRELGRNPLKRAHTKRPKRQRITPVNYIISRCLKDRRKISTNYII
jgi:hypothetical protein